MTLEVFSVFDVKLEAYMRPFFVQTRGVAIRSFVDSADEESLYGAHPHDFVLFHLGSYDDVQATFILLDAKVPLGSVAELKGTGRPRTAPKPRHAKEKKKVSKQIVGFPEGK